jgi:anti-sigma regulatory factor (Ser/Thr protein kinase)
VPQGGQQVTPTGPDEATPAAVLTGVTAANVAEVRRRVAAAAQQLGMGPDRYDPFVVAVNEIVINAIRHGGGHADVTILTGRADLVVEVRDNGPGLPDGSGSHLPPPTQPGGRGLWLVYQLCPDVAFDSGPTGTTVRLALALASTDHC